MCAFKVVFDEDVKILQTGQTFEAIVSDTAVEFEAISSFELRSELLPNLTINLHFLPPGGRMMFSVLREEEG